MNAIASASTHSPAQPTPPQSHYWRDVGARLLRDRVAVICLGVLALLVLAALAAPLIAPSDPTKGSALLRLNPSAHPAIGWAPTSWAATC